jgi:hypothetical protein
MPFSAVPTLAENPPKGFSRLVIKVGIMTPPRRSMSP